MSSSSSSTSLQAQVDYYNKHGFVVVENVFSKTDLNQLSKHCTQVIKNEFEMDPIDKSIKMKRIRKSQMIVPRGKSRFDINLVEMQFLPEQEFCSHNKFPVLSEDRFLFPPALVPLLQVLLSNSFKNATQNLLVSFPGSSEQEWHTDVEPLFSAEESEIKTPHFYLTMWCPLVEMTADLGPVQIRSQHDQTEYSMHHIRLGSVVLFDGLTYHRGLANVDKSKKIRSVFTSVFCKPWYADANLMKDDMNRLFVAETEEDTRELHVFKDLNNMRA